MGTAWGRGWRGDGDGPRCPAWCLPAQEGSRRSPLRKERRGLRVAPLPAVSTPRGSDFPSFSFDFWGRERKLSLCPPPRLCPQAVARLVTRWGRCPAPGWDRVPPLHPAHLAEVWGGAAAAGVGPQVWQGLPLALGPQAGLVEGGLHEARVAVELHQVKDLRGEEVPAQHPSPRLPGGLLEQGWGGRLPHLELLEAEHVRGGGGQHVLPNPSLPVDVDGAHRVAGEELVVDPPCLLCQLGEGGQDGARSPLPSPPSPRALGQVPTRATSRLGDRHQPHIQHRALGTTRCSIPLS